MKKKKYLVEFDEIKINNALISNYKSYLTALKRSMIRDYNTKIIKFYSENREDLVVDSEIVFDDLNDAKKLMMIIEKIGKKWKKKFADISNLLSMRVMREIKLQVNRNHKKMRDIYPFILTDTRDRKRMATIIQSSIAENVSLIKSIPEKYHQEITGDVMRNVAAGNNMSELKKNLSHHSSLTQKRINLIVRDQVAKATVLIDRQNAIDAGFKKAIWQKSIAGKTHREDHAAAHNNEFDLGKGCLISGEYILPRQKINCKCSYKLVIKIGEES